jgi:hypothetical protein
MDEQVQKSRQDLHNISLQYTQRKEVLDKLAELMQYGVTAENIIHWTKIFKENNLDISTPGNDLLQYCGIKYAYNSLSTKVGSLKSEVKELNKTRQNLKIMTDKIIQHEWQQFTQTIQTLSQKFGACANSSITQIKNVEE